MTRLWLLALLVLVPSVSVSAATLHHWRFENVPGFLVDSVGSAALIAVNQAQQVPLPSAGRGQNFPPGFSVSGGTPNAAAAEFDGTDDSLGAIIPEITSSFSVETFFHLDTLDDPFGKILAGNGSDENNPALISWALEVRTDDAGGIAEELLVLLSDGASLDFVGSGLSVETGKDYYGAAAVDIPGGTVTFFLQDLSDGGPLQQASRPHNVGTLNTSDQLSIGGLSSSSFFDIDGLIDEVRISDQALRAQELLANNIIPEPTTAFLVFGGLLGVAAWGWRF